jgi:hypothetical protein
MKKFKEWLFRPDLELSNRWWHRLFKIIFVLSIITSTIYGITYLSDSYGKIIHQWSFVDTFYGRLSETAYTDKVFPIHELLADNEVIGEDYPRGWGLTEKRYIEPMSPLFLPEGDIKTFCSDNLDKHIKNIAYTNDIKLFSDINPTAYTLYDDIDAFSDYLKSNSYSTKCVFIDAFTLINDDDTTSRLVFLRPETTRDYVIYAYNGSFLNIIWAVLFSVAALIFGVLCTMVIYYKLVLYIVFGSRQEKSEQT